MFYEIATLTLAMGTAGAAGEQVAQFAAAGRGKLLGCWINDIGQLNQMQVLRGFSSIEDLHAERLRCLSSENPFGCAESTQALRYDSYKGFPWMEHAKTSAESGVTGPVYEIRCYGIKTAGVQKTIDLWQEYLPARHALSPCVVAMLALDGSPRFVNIWAYPSIDARSKARADAVAQGIWPPKGGPAWLTTDMVSTIALPHKVSPMQ